MNVTFREVKLTTTRKGKCSRCGKKTTRRVKVWQTINPFNKNAMGWPKSETEIHAELVGELKQKEAEPLMCSGCEDEAKNERYQPRGSA